MANTPEWKTWCRLCAKEEDVDVSVFLRDETLNLPEELDKCLSVEVSEYDSASTKICEVCTKFMASIVIFRERSSRVQNLFTELEFCEKMNGIGVDLRGMKMKYGLLDDESVEIDLPDFKEQFDQPIDEPEVEMGELEYLEINYLEVNGIKREAEEDAFQDVEEADPVKHNESAESIHAETVLVNVENIVKSYESNDDNDTHGDDNDNDTITEPEEDFDDFEPEEEDFKHKSPPKRKRASTTLIIDCEHCGKTFKRYSSFKSHMLAAHDITVDEQVFSCSSCDKKFPTARKLESHEISHIPLSERNRIPCPYCDKMFSKDTNVKAHIKTIHHDEKPYICEECGKAYKTIGALKEHKYTHVEEAPFQCSNCDKRFKNKSRLKTHEDTHNDTIYVCTTCGLQLNTRRTLKMHMLVHSDQKQHKCNYCGNEFKRAKALKNHLILHTGLKPYRCTFCDKTFANGSNCRSHKKKSHPKELAAMEAAGAKTCVTNMPKLEQLKAVAAVKPPQPRPSNRRSGLSAAIIAQHQKKLALQAQQLQQQQQLQNQQQQPEIVDLDSTESLNKQEEASNEFVQTIFDTIPII